MSDCLVELLPGTCLHHVTANSGWTLGPYGWAPSMRGYKLIDPNKAQPQPEADGLNTGMANFTETLPDTHQLPSDIATKDDEEYVPVLLCETVMSSATRNPPVPAWLRCALIACIITVVIPYASCSPLGSTWTPRCPNLTKPATLVIMLGSVVAMLGTYLATVMQTSPADNIGNDTTRAREE